MIRGPDPNYRYPLENLGYELDNACQTAFLKDLITRDNIIIGAYSYYDDPEGPEEFETKNVLYQYKLSPQKLIIGKFCSLAHKTTFIMGGNHKIDGFSSFPFGIFRHGWEQENPLSEFPNKGDTVVGNDVWFGYDCTILQGVSIGDGAIIGAKAVVTKDVAPYTIVGGNPATVIRTRFDQATIDTLLKIRWWDWDAEKISRNIKAIIGRDLQKLISM